MKKVVQDLTSGGLDWAREKWKFGVGSKFIRQGEKNAVKYADEIIVLSKDVQKYFMDTYGRETHFIPNGVNRPENRKAKLITDNFGLEKDSYILFLGRLVPEKGIRYLVEAFKNVKTDKKLVIAGGSSDTDSFMEELKELAKGDDRILFTGFVQGAMLDELYSNAYIYTLPSDLEGMPLSLLEAMSYGNCCLVSDIPECAEVVEDKALIFKKSDVEDLREKLQEACDHPEMVMKMKEKIYDARTGMGYVLVGDYYLPALKLPRTRPIGRWGMLHKAYLKLRKPAYYQSLLLSGKLDTVLANVEEQAAERYKVLIEQMSQREETSEKLKEENQMEWVRRMNNLENRAAEIVKAELIYTFERR